MCNRYRMSAKQAELAQCFGIDPALIMPEPEPLPPPELFPKRSGWIVRQVRRSGHARSPREKARGAWKAWPGKLCARPYA